MWPRFIPMPILMTPQWPLVVTASIFQLPSKVAAVASGTEQNTANAVARVKAHRRLAIMGDPHTCVCCTEWNCPGDYAVPLDVEVNGQLRKKALQDYCRKWCSATGRIATGG